MMTTDILPFYTHEQAWHDEELPPLHKYGAIGCESYEQLNFHRTDPFPLIPFEHVLKELRTKEAMREIFHSLIAVGAFIAVMVVCYG